MAKKLKAESQTAACLRTIALVIRCLAVGEREHARAADTTCRLPNVNDKHFDIERRLFRRRIRPSTESQATSAMHWRSVFRVLERFSAICTVRIAISNFHNR